MKKLLLTMSLSLLVLPINADELTPATKGSEDLPPPRVAPPKPVAAPQAPTPVAPAPPPTPVAAPAEPVKATPTPLPAPARAGFGGFYVGGSLGFVFSDSDVYLDTLGPSTVYTVGGLDENGPGIGLHAGWGTILGQNRNLYAGIELGYQFNNGIDSSHSFVSGPAIEVEHEDSWILSGRLGYLLAPETMLYGRAGLVRTDFSFASLGTSSSDHANGLVLGLGLEHRLNTNLSVRAEYAYLNHEDMNFNNHNGALSALEVDNDSSLVTLGLSYTF